MPLLNFSCSTAARPRDDAMPSLQESVPGQAVMSISRCAPTSASAQRLQAFVEGRQIAVADPTHQHILLDGRAHRVVDEAAGKGWPGRATGRPRCRPAAERSRPSNSPAGAAAGRWFPASAASAGRGSPASFSSDGGFERLLADRSLGLLPVGLPTLVEQQLAALFFDQAAELVDAELGDQKLHARLGAVLLLAQAPEDAPDRLRQRQHFPGRHELADRASPGAAASPARRRRRP